MITDMRPYLSIVVTSRNDNHGDEFSKRMRIFLRALIHQTNKYKLPTELVVVEWNPPSDTPYLSEVMPAPKAEDYLRVKYIIVPPHIHQQYRFASSYHLYQMIAKNVGIRRATADYILCCNVDLIFSDALMEQLSKQNLSPSSFYRANRCDIPSTIQEDMTVPQQLDFAKKNIIARLGMNRDFVHLGEVPAWIKKSWLLCKVLNLAFYCSQRFFHSEERVRFFSLDKFACGDFTLLHKDAWNAIHGYVEVDLYALHIDTMALVAAEALGYKQVIFRYDACVYHIDHANTWETMDPNQRVKFVNEKPSIGWDVVSETAVQLIKAKSVYTFNKSDWGFANEKFEEINL